MVCFVGISQIVCPPIYKSIAQVSGSRYLSSFPLPHPSPLPAFVRAQPVSSGASILYALRNCRLRDRQCWVYFVPFSKALHNGLCEVDGWRKINHDGQTYS